MHYTHSLKGLEGAVEEKVPNDFAVFKGRNVPYKEIGKHGQWRWEHDPTDGGEEDGQQQEHH